MRLPDNLNKLSNGQRNYDLRTGDGHNRLTGNDCGNTVGDSRMTIKVVKVVPAIYPPDADWRIYDESGEIDESLEPDAFLKEAVGARPFCYFRAEKSADGWHFKSRYKGRPLYW